MGLLYTLLFFILGLLFGSFFNVVGLRVPKKEPFVNDRSGCPNCGHTLEWYELIPVLSYIFQRGKCRNCKQPISRQYPIIEILTGALFAFSFYMVGFDWELVTLLLLVSMSVILIVTDLKYMLIPNRILLFFLPLFLIMRIVSPLDPWWSPIIGAVVGYGIVFLIIIISNGGMGAGDMKLYGLIGIVLGMYEVILSFFLASMLGAVLGIIMRIVGKTKKSQQIPFGPYIVTATLITYFYGSDIIKWYLSLFT